MTLNSHHYIYLAKITSELDQAFKGDELETRGRDLDGFFKITECFFKYSDMITWMSPYRMHHKTIDNNMSGLGSFDRTMNEVLEHLQTMGYKIEKRRGLVIISQQK